MENIPILDVSEISIHCGQGESLDGSEIPSETDCHWRNLAGELFDALSQFGFVYIVNHGVDQEKVKRAFEESQRFFELPCDVKEKFLLDMKKGYRGYTRPGQQILSDRAFHEFRECFSLEHPQDADVFETEIQCQDVEVELTSFLRSLEQLRQASESVVQLLLKLLAKSLDLVDEGHFIKSYNAGHDHQFESSPVISSSMVRTHFYPAIPIDIEIPPGSVRCGTHTDFGILTLLFQDSMGGLEVKNVTGKWIPASPIPGSILVNTGDVLEFWTGGIFPATPHRVLIPPAEIERREKRQSIAFFVNPDNETLLSPLKSKSGRIVQTEQEERSKAKENTESPILTFREHYQKRLSQSYKY